MFFRRVPHRLALLLPLLLLLLRRPHPTCAVFKPSTLAELKAGAQSCIYETGTGATHPNAASNYKWRTGTGICPGYTNGIMPTWNTGLVTSFKHLFYYAMSFNADIGRWDVSNVNTFEHAFNRASKFNVDLSAWKIKVPSDWRSAFIYASMFDQALCGPQWEQLNVFRTSGKWKPATITGVTPNTEYGGDYWTTNMFASSSAALLCCKPGEYLNPDQGTPSPPTSVCNSCRTGRYRAAPQDYTNPTSCKTCGLGHAAPDAETACAACEGGRYQDEQDSGALSTVRLSFGCKVRTPPPLDLSSFPTPFLQFSILAMHPSVRACLNNGRGGKTVNSNGSGKAENQPTKVTPCDPPNDRGETEGSFRTWGDAKLTTAN